jgi:hypothetical protein
MLIRDATDFWQAVECTAYAMEGESEGYGREKMFELSKTLDEYLAKHPEAADNFPMQAVARLAGAFRCQRHFNNRTGELTRVRQ